LFCKPLWRFHAVMKLAVEEWLPLHQCWHLRLRRSGHISTLAQGSLPLPQIGTTLPCFLVADLGSPDCFASHFVVFVMKLAVEEWSPLHQCWHLKLRRSGHISTLAQGSLPLPQIGTSSPCFLVADLDCPDCFASHFVVFVRS
jgi:hypothetical protein